jgi:hypothetical protein
MCGTVNPNLPLTPGHPTTGTDLTAPLRLRVLAVVLLISAGSGAYAQGNEEYQVKAAFLFHFVQLVDWPSEALVNDEKSLTLCTFGKDPFGGALETTLQGKSIGARALRIRHLKQVQEVQGCQLLFVGGNERKADASLLAGLKDQAILTVGEGDDFAKQGGMIGFCMENNKVRFDINVDTAVRAKLKISSRLLQLARSVIGNHP